MLDIVVADEELQETFPFVKSGADKNRRDDHCFYAGQQIEARSPMPIVDRSASTTSFARHDIAQIATMRLAGANSYTIRMNV